MEEITPVTGSTDSYLVKGTYFTPSTEVMVNEEWCDTQYINDTSVMITGCQLKSTDEIIVSQRSNSSTRKALTTTEPKTYARLLKSTKAGTVKVTETPVPQEEKSGAGK